jgi:tRNA G18 (ribose-2'-O)-methylase SpoU
LPAASDLSDSAEEAETLRAACDLCPTAQRVALALGPLCAQLVNVHTRAYLHPLHAPRLLVLLHALIDGAAAADEPAWRAVVINMLSGCAEGCCGVVENALSEARTGRSDSSLVGAPDQTDWLCARVAHCSGALAACTAAVPEVRSIVTFVGEQLLQGLSTELASAAGPQAPRVRLMAADALSAVVRAGLYGARAPDSAHDGAPGIVAVHPLLAKPMQSAREAMLAACAEGAGRLTSMDGDGNGVDLRLRYRSEVAQWAALAALLDAAGDAPSVAIVSGRSSPPPPIRVREGIATAVAHDLELVDRRHQTWLASCVAALKQSSGDAEALHTLLRCAGPLIRNALRHSVVDDAAVTDGAVSSVSSTVSSVSSTVSHIRALHRACLESLRLVGSTALQPSLCAAVANALLSVPVLHCTGLQAESFGAFDFLHGLGAARPFAAQLAASRLCDAVLEQPRACLPWASRIHELLLHGDAALPVCSTALLSTLDDDLAPRLSTRAVTSVSRADLAAAVPADSQSTAATCNLASTTSAAAAPVVDGCATAEDEGIQALLDALMAGGADAQRRAAAHRVRALALRLLLELPLRAESLATGASDDGALALLNAVTALLLDSVASPDASFPKWYLPQTQGARRCLRSWQALSLLAPRLPELGAPAQAAASCVWRLLSEKPLPRVRQYMESVAVALVLSDARSAPTVLCNFVADPTLSRDAAASAVLIVGAALVALPLDSRQAAMNTVLPHLLGWATCTFHTARLLSIGVLSRLAALAPDATITDDLDAAASMRRTPAAAARTDVDTPAVAPSATDGDGARDGALAPPALLATLGSFFATQPQIVAATAAIDPLLWLPAHSPSASAALYDARGAALAAGAGDGESAPVSTLERLGRQMSALVHASKEEETAVLQKEASERRLALTEYLRGQLAALRVSTASSVLSAPVSSAPVSSAPVSSAPVSSAPASSAPAGIEPLLAPAAASPAAPLLAPAAASPVAPATSRAAHQVAQRKTALGGHGWWSVEPLVLDVLSAAAAADEEADEEAIGRNRRQSGAEFDEAATAASGALEDEGAASHAASFTPMHAQLADLRTTAVQSKRRAHELIVVASLLDKPTNLGGICRSAEIFGAAALVLPDKRLASHEAFKGLSMGAERWLPMEEVKPAELSRYLRARRAAGWRIVALEQAAGSVPLQEYYSTLGAHDDAEEASTTHPSDELAYQYDFEPGKHIGLGLGDHASGAIVVNDVVDGTLAQQKGIIIGMTLRAVNGQSMAGMKKDDALNLVRSIPPGAARRLTFTNELLTQAAPIRRSRGRSPRALEKTVLLLGAEGTGVPASLLAEVDQCVEIPQRGLLRSLNVHVSAAIAMWEHARAAG